MSNPYRPPDDQDTQVFQADDPNATREWPQAQAPAPGFSQHAEPTFTPGRNFAQERARQAGSGFTAGERSARASGKGTIGNWFQTGDSHLDPKSEQGQALAPAVPDGWSVAGLITAFFVPIAGLVLSIVAFAEAKKNHRRVHGTAIGGFVVSLLGCIAWTLYWVVIIVAFAAVTNAVNTSPYGG